MAHHRTAMLALVILTLACAHALPESRRDLRNIQSRRLAQSCSTTNFCQNKAGGIYANPCSSSSFIQCSNGQTYVQQCAQGTVWDTSCSCCNFPSSKPASPTPTPSPPATTPAPKSPSGPPPSSPSPTPSPKSPSPASGSIKAAYWGQGPASSTLASVCGKYNIIFLSFLPNFGNGQDVTSNSAINIAGHSLTQTAADIKTCQGQGKKIVLSIGGGVGNYGFSSASDAQSTAGNIWKAYLGGSGTNRPFGSVVLDGVDLDVEQPNGAQYYADFVKALKGLYGQGSKTFLLTAVPQCPFPDANLGPKAGTALGDAASSFDYVSIQFYNNPSCGGSNTVSGYGPWKDWAKTSGAKLLPTFPAAAKDTGSGYQDASAVAAELNQIKSDSTYGGWNLFTAEDDNGFSSQLPS